MKGFTKRETMAATRVRSRIGLFLGTVALFWSGQLLGKDQGLAAARRDEREEAPQHVLVISIPDRKLAVMEDGRVLKVYSVAVGAAVSPSPTGTLKIVNKVIGPTYYHQGKVIPPGKSNPLGDRWMGLSLKWLWHPWDQRSQLHRQSCLARMHPHGQARCGGVVQPGARRRRGGDSRRA